MPNTSLTASNATRVQPARGGSGGDGRCRGRRAVRHQRRVSSPDVEAAVGAVVVMSTARSASISTTTPAVASPTPSLPCGRVPPRCRARSTVMANGSATVTSCRSWPTSSSRWVSSVCRRASRQPHLVCPPCGRARELLGRPAAAVRGLDGVRAQGRPAHLGAEPGERRLRARRSGGSRQRHPRARVGDGRPFDAREKAEALGIELDGKTVERCHRHAQEARARGLPLRGGRCVARVAHAWRCRVGAAVLPTRIVLGRHRSPVRHQRPPVERRRGRCRDLGHREGLG